MNTTCLDSQEKINRKKMSSEKNSGDACKRRSQKGKKKNSEYYWLVGKAISLWARTLQATWRPAKQSSDQNDTSE